MVKKRALIFGIGGQDGSYLAEVLLKNNYEVYGTTRKSSVDNLWRINHIKDKLSGIQRVEFTDDISILRTILSIAPDEIYNEADQDNVGWSHSVPGYSVDVTIKAAQTILEAVRIYLKNCKVFLPCSATIFGDSQSPQDEFSDHNPLSPYACAKLAVYNLARMYRQVHGIWVSTGILYNHDSPRRGKGYLLQDIIEQCKRVAEGKTNKISVGSLDQIVDIGYAREFAHGIYAILQYKTPTDMILSSGRSYKIKDIINRYTDYFSISKKVEISINPDKISPIPTELIGDTSRAQKMIGWAPKYCAIKMVEILSLSNTDMLY